MKVKFSRISSSVLKELSRIIVNELNNDLLKNVNLTACEVTNDLSFAKVYFTYIGNYSKEEIMNELTNSNSRLRYLLANNIKLRHTPELIFIFDESIEYGNKIEKLIEKIHNKE